MNSHSVTASEAMQMIFGFDVHGRKLAIKHLSVQEENQQCMSFDERNPQEALEKKVHNTPWIV